MTTRRFLFLIASARIDGNSEALARRAARTLPPDVEQSWLRLSDLPLPPFADRRHDGDGAYSMPEGNGRILLDETLAATDLVFVAPLYWYSLPASAKLYLDHWSAWLRVPGLEFRARMADKTAWAISTCSESDPALAAPLFRTLRLSADYFGMRWGGELLGEANRPRSIFEDAWTLAKADRLFTADTAGH